jgi:hypothetical protein
MNHSHHNQTPFPTLLHISTEDLSPDHTFQLGETAAIGIRTLLGGYHPTIRQITTLHSEPLLQPSYLLAQQQLEARETSKTRQALISNLWA